MAKDVDQTDTDDFRGTLTAEVSGGGAPQWPFN